jgi:hypothetical protein
MYGDVSYEEKRNVDVMHGKYRPCTQIQKTRVFRPRYTLWTLVRLSPKPVFWWHSVKTKFFTLLLVFLRPLECHHLANTPMYNQSHCSIKKNMVSFTVESCTVQFKKNYYWLANSAIYRRISNQLISGSCPAFVAQTLDRWASLTDCTYVQSQDYSIFNTISQLKHTLCLLGTQEWFFLTFNLVLGRLWYIF